MSNIYKNTFKEISKFEVAADEGMTFGQAEQLQNDIERLNERLNERLCYLFSIGEIDDNISEKLELLTDFAKRTDDGIGSRNSTNGAEYFIVINFKNAQFLYQQMSEISNLLGE